MARPLARHRAQGRSPRTAPMPLPRPGTPSCCLRPLPGRPQLWPSALALSSVPVLPGGLALPPGTVPLSCDAPHTRTPGGRGQPREGRLGPCPQAEGSVPTHGARPSVPAQGPRGQPVLWYWGRLSPARPPGVPRLGPHALRLCPQALPVGVSPQGRPSPSPCEVACRRARLTPMQDSRFSKSFTRSPQQTSFSQTRPHSRVWWAGSGRRFWGTQFNLLHPACRWQR